MHRRVIVQVGMNGRRPAGRELCGPRRATTAFTPPPACGPAVYEPRAAARDHAPLYATLNNLHVHVHPVQR